MKIRKQALIIGALGGLGSATIELLINNGWDVFATDIQQKVLTHYLDIDHITPIVMDVTDEDSIKETFKLISGQTGHLDALINMAGILKVGSIAERPISDLKKVLEINLFGVYRVNKQFIPLLLERKGRIINLSSEVGKQTTAPFNGIYSISKHALEAYSDALRRELNFLGIRVIKIQPGPFKTNMTKNAEKLFNEAEKSSIYFKRNLTKGISYLPKVYTNAHDPIYVAKTIKKALESANPKTAYSIKVDIPRSILNLLPVKWTDKLYKKILS